MSDQPGATTTAIFKDQRFYVPSYQITLEGQPLPIVRDVKEVSYTDNLEEMDSFEFVLHDWDPVRLEPKYSSPYDARGNQRTLTPNGPKVPLLDPGVEVSLKLGYVGEGALTTMLKGKIVTISPSFPSSGQPSLRIRALNPMHTLQKAQVSMTFENKTDSEIAKEIADSLNVEIEIPPGQVAGETRYDFMAFAREYPINFLIGRARRQGYDLYMKPPRTAGGQQVLFFGRTQPDGTTYELEWGRSLVSFTPSVKTKGQITRVVVRGWRPGGRGDDRRITGVATIDQVQLKLPDTKLLSAIDKALQEKVEEVVEDPIENQTEADAKALGILLKKLQDLITGNGSTVGTPRLRAGKTVSIKGVGTRYSGTYVLTETTHKIDAGGYTTEFKGRMEGGPP